MDLLDSRSIAHWRMRSLRLTGAPLAAPEEAVRWLGAVQSQDYGPAKWSVAQRAAGDDAGDAALDRAFAEGAILRTHALRPTWHFVLPADVRWIQELTALRVHAQNAHMYRQVGLDAAVLAASSKVLVETLTGGRQRTRDELAASLERAGIAAEGVRLAYIVMNAELNGLICSGALRGKQHTYALLEERAPQAKRLPRHAALAELTRRYFTSHGPATMRDFKWWSSLTIAEIKQGLEMVASELEQEVLDGVTYWFVPPAPRLTIESPTVHLLQGYDEYLVGYSESKFVLDASGAARAFPGDRGIYSHAVILDGQIAGRWKRTVKKSGVILDVALYAPFDEAQTRALQAAADRHGVFLGLPATVSSIVL